MEVSIERISSFVCSVVYNDLPKHVILEMKRVILDSIGVAINGHSSERGKVAVDFATSFGGLPEASIAGHGVKVSSMNAAFANAELITALDNDAMLSKALHDPPILIAATLALGERNAVSGKQLILSCALAFEISGRLKLATIAGSQTSSDKAVWPSVSGQSTATLGATVGAAKILNLDLKGVANAIGIAGYICPPSTMTKFLNTSPVRMTKYGPPGWAAQAGITAALLSRMGYTGDTDLFSGDFGFWRYSLMKKQGEWDMGPVVKDLGTNWLCHEIVYKQYPGGL